MLISSFCGLKLQAGVEEYEFMKMHSEKWEMLRELKKDEQLKQSFQGRLCNSIWEKMSCRVACTADTKDIS